MFLQGVGLVAVDEAHLVTEWGVAFRPNFRDLCVIRDALPNVPVLAVTATATPFTQRDILRTLHMRVGLNKCALDGHTLTTHCRVP